MSKSKLLDDFQKNISDELLKALLEVHDTSPTLSQDDKVAILVRKLDEVFRGKENEDK